MKTVKLDFLLFYLLQNCPFDHVLKKQAHSFFGAWSFLLVHIRFTPSEGIKGFVSCFFQ